MAARAFGQRSGARPARIILAGIVFTLAATVSASMATVGPPTIRYVELARAPAQVSSASAADGDIAMHQTWCGDEADARAGVEHVSAAERTGAPNIKLVIARPRDVPDRMSHWANQLQGAAESIGVFVAQQSDGPTPSRLKTLRWDFGTPCDPYAVDLVMLDLPETQGYYMSSSGDSLDRVWGDVRRRLPSSTAAAPRDYLIYVAADDSEPLNERPPGHPRGICGEAYSPHDDQPGPANRANEGGYVGAVYGDCLTAAVVLHETAHMLGAVQAGAPHYVVSPDPHGHCSDAADDVMCKGLVADHARRCPGASETELAAVLDCGNDDYWAPRGTVQPGSWLAAHWNVANSTFLADCTELAPACGTYPAAALRGRQRAGAGARQTLTLASDTLASGTIRLRPRARASEVTRNELCGHVCRVPMKVTQSWDADGALRVSVRVPQVPRGVRLTGALCVSWRGTSTRTVARRVFKRAQVPEPQRVCSDSHPRGGRLSVRITTVEQSRHLASWLSPTLVLSVQRARRHENHTFGFRARRLLRVR